MTSLKPFAPRAPQHEKQKQAAVLNGEQSKPLPARARAAFEAIGIHIHEPTDDAPLLARWQRAVA